MGEEAIMALAAVNLTPRIGSGIRADAATLLGGGAAAEIRALLERRGVLVVRDLWLDDGDLLALAATLGAVRLGTVAREGDDGILKVTFDRSQNPTGPNSFRGTFYWHMDGTYDDVPPLAAVLTPRILSATGGETEFANTYAAYDELPAADKQRFAGLRVRHELATAHRLYTPEPTA
jgi:alpha-ketoglutarate-dependent taurine dioxygenase